MCKIISFEDVKNANKEMEMYNSRHFDKKLSAIKPENIKNISLIPNFKSDPAISILANNEIVNFPIINGFQIHSINELLRKLDFDLTMNIEFKTYRQYTNLIEEVNLRLHGLKVSIPLGSGLKNVTLEEMRTQKFNVISRIGISKQRRNRQLFIMDVIPPTKFGADCKGHTWYNVLLKTDEDYKQAKDFIEELFQIQCPELNKDNCIEVVKSLEKELQNKGKVEDWGACDVTYLPYAEQFRK